MANYVLIPTHTTHANEMTCQFTCTLYMSNEFNMLVTTILANYSIYYVILYHITYFTLNISCRWYDTHMHTCPKVFIQLWINFTLLVQDIRGICV